MRRLRNAGRTRPTRAALSTTGRSGETAHVGREELTEDGGPVPRPLPPRTDGPARYADRFRPEPPAIDLGPRGDADTVDLGAEPPTRSWPSWLTRTAAGVGLLATAVIAVATSDRDADVPEGLPDARPEQSTAPHDPPPMAPLDVSGVEVDLWDSNGFSYEVTVTNRSETALELIDVGPAMSGIELAWEHALVLPAGQRTTVRVDFLVMNCLAATSSAAPVELRLVVRGQAVDAVAALAQVPTVEPAAFIESAGQDICGPRGGIVLG